MAIVSPLNPDALCLQVTWNTFEGTAKTDVLSTTATVYTRDGAGFKVTALAPVALTRDSGTSTWRYIWAAPDFVNPGQLTVEYQATDSNGAVGVTTEDLFVLASEMDPATVDQTDKLDTLMDCLLGRQKLDANTNRWTLYRRDGSILKTFDVTDDLGAPSVENVFERTPA